MKYLNRICPICKSKYGEILESISMQLPKNVPLPKAYDIVCCNECGFAYADVDANQDQYNNYYTNFNMYSCDAEIKLDSTICSNRVRYSILEKFVSENYRILDMGCGSGELLGYLRDMEKYGGHKLELYGIDPSEESITKLKNRGIDGEVGNVFEEVPLHLSGSFDIVICTTVLEHIYDLAGFIMRVKQYLKPRGMIYLDVPAVEGIRKYYSPIANNFNHEHINYFSQRSLDNLLLLNGFKRKNSEDQNLCTFDFEQPEMFIEAIYQMNDNEYDRVERDIISKKIITEYFSRENLSSKVCQEKIMEFIHQHGDNIVIWGAGSYTMQMIAKLPDIADYIRFFVDNNIVKQGTFLCGKKVYAPVKLVGDDTPILILSMKNAKDIIKQMKLMKISNPFIVG